MESKKNYYLKSEEIIANLNKKDRKPRLLLHACCAPCSSFPLTYLCPHFDVTIYYCNSNIFPESEYLKRLNELKRFLPELKNKTGFEVKLVIPNYDVEEYHDFLKDYKDYKEGELRCFLCYERRMDESYRYAVDNKYDFFTTTLSVSRFKNSQKINEIGAKLEEKYPSVRYFYSDFKKNDGALKVKEMVNEYHLYQQKYCGCKYSMEDRMRFDKEQSLKEENK